jgi:CelD/BcsL family acetyltransferase involved in cellulose biosynthesis
MKVTVLPAPKLTPELAAAWGRLQREEPALASPFFRPEFTQAVAAVRGDVEVAVLEEGGEPAGFFPFQRRGWGVGKPAGGPMCDYQGVVARPGLAFSAQALVAACGLSAWDFDHVPVAQEPFRPYHHAVGESPYVDLSAGFDAFLAGRCADGGRSLKELPRKRRKLEREKGEVRFEYHATDRRAFEALLAWKSGQYRQTGVTDVFAFPWTVRLLERVLASQEEAFHGKLSALYAGGRLVAVELGLCSFGVSHGWFPAYDREFAAYSPGLILLLELVRESAARGARRYDLGKGATRYKNTFASGSVPLAEGSVARGPLLRLARRGWLRARDWARSSPLGAPARAAGRWTRSLRGWLAFR